MDGGGVVDGHQGGMARRLWMLLLSLWVVGMGMSLAAVPGELCPSAVVNAIAVENLYGSMLAQLGGQCVRVTSIINDPSADPHEFQTDVQVGKTYQTAELVVQNGLGYDEFSNKIIATLRRKPLVITGSAVVGSKPGDNPHLWYSPGYVMRISQAITHALKQLRPRAATYFDAQARDFAAALSPYHALIEEIKRRFAGTPIGATETIFVYMAEATGLKLVSPPRFMQAIAEGTSPTVRDVAVFHEQIQQKHIKVLVYNTQTVSNLTSQLQALAHAVGIPVVGVTETLVPVQDTFQSWQVRQLRDLLTALESADGSAERR
jgi:zinc/manganese transport system substrate-binding protein